MNSRVIPDRILPTNECERRVTSYPYVSPQTSPYIEGFVIFEVAFNPLPSNVPDDPLDVEGIYTYRAEPVGTDAVSIDVEVFPAKRNRYTLPAAQPTTGTTTGIPKR